MDNLIHIRVGKELKKQMQKLIDVGMFSNQAEIAREGIRNVLMKYNAGNIEQPASSEEQKVKKK